MLSRVASLGREMELFVSGWSPLPAKSVLALWFSSENQLEIAVLSQVNHVFVVNITINLRVIHNARRFHFKPV